MWPEKIPLLLFFLAAPWTTGSFSDGVSVQMTHIGQKLRISTDIRRISGCNANFPLMRTVSKTRLPMFSRPAVNACGHQLGSRLWELSHSPSWFSSIKWPVSQSVHAVEGNSLRSCSEVTGVCFGDLSLIEIMALLDSFSSHAKHTGESVVSAPRWRQIHRKDESDCVASSSSFWFSSDPH